MLTDWYCAESSYSKQNVIGSDQMYIKKQAKLLKTPSLEAFLVIHVGKQRIWSLNLCWSHERPQADAYQSCKRCRKATKAKENKRAKPSVGSLGGDPAHICADTDRGVPAKGEPVLT